MIIKVLFKITFHYIELGTVVLAISGCLYGIGILLFFDRVIRDYNGLRKKNKGVNCLILWVSLYSYWS